MLLLCISPWHRAYFIKPLEQRCKVTVRCAWESTYFLDLLYCQQVNLIRKASLNLSIENTFFTGNSIPWIVNVQEAIDCEFPWVLTSNRGGPLAPHSVARLYKQSCNCHLVDVFHFLVCYQNKGVFLLAPKVKPINSWRNVSSLCPSTILFVGLCISIFLSLMAFQTPFGCCKTWQILSNYFIREEDAWHIETRFKKVSLLTLERIMFLRYNTKLSWEEFKIRSFT